MSQKILLLIFIIILISACSTRDRNNPFDPNYQSDMTSIYLSIIPFENYNEISWDDPQFKDYIGFNLYRKLEMDASFQLLKTLSNEFRLYKDSTIEYSIKHDYYLKILGKGVESKQSPIISTIPGPGYNWVVDHWGYQVFKTSYDTKYIINRSYTIGPPQDMVIAKNSGIALITYTFPGMIEIIDLATGETLNQISEISKPFKVCYDSIENHFWVIDSSGYLYNINASTFQITAITSNLMNPIEINISEQSGLINIVDLKAKKILRYTRAGELFEQIDSINQSSLKGPERFIYDEVRERYWLSDNDGNRNYIYTKLSSEENFQQIDSLDNAGDIELCPSEDAVYIISLSIDGSNNSSIMKLYANGIRQILINDLYYPQDLVINHYDETILVAESYYGRILHYNRDNILLGYSEFYNFPIKILVE